MLTPTITAMKQNDRFTVQVTGRFGGGYTSPGHTAEDAAAMIIRDAPRYDCGKEPLQLGVAPEVEREIKAAFARGSKLAACLTCKARMQD